MVTQYIKGRDNVGADCMSRFAVLTDEQQTRHD